MFKWRIRSEDEGESESSMQRERERRRGMGNEKSEEVRQVLVQVEKWGQSF